MRCVIMRCWRWGARTRVLVHKLTGTGSGLSYFARLTQFKYRPSIVSRAPGSRHTRERRRSSVGGAAQWARGCGCTCARTCVYHIVNPGLIFSTNREYIGFSLVQVREFQCDRFEFCYVNSVCWYYSIIDTESRMAFLWPYSRNKVAHRTMM